MLNPYIYENPSGSSVMIAHIVSRAIIIVYARKCDILNEQRYPTKSKGECVISPYV